jgi:hypothetical protein
LANSTASGRPTYPNPITQMKFEEFSMKKRI